MSIEHLAVNLPKRQRYRTMIPCLVCGEIISGRNCKPFRQEEALTTLWEKGREAWKDVESATEWVEKLRGNEVNDNGKEKSNEEKTSEETTTQE